MVLFLFICTQQVLKGIKETDRPEDLDEPTDWIRVNGGAMANSMDIRCISGSRI